MKKKQIIIATPALETGGLTSSLLPLLRSIDYEKYDVDLIFSRTEGKYLGEVPKEVNILPQAVIENNPFAAKIKKFFLYLVRGYLFKGLKYKLYRKNIYKNEWVQIMSGQALTSVARKLDKHYDIAVGYAEGFPNNFIAAKVDAENKVAYIHVDVILAGLNPETDRKMLGEFDKVVLVSAECKKSFDKVFPEYSDKSLVVENFAEIDRIRALSKAEVTDFNIDNDCFNIVTAARLDNEHKAIYRGVYAMKKLKDNGFDNVRWYVFGDGKDKADIEALILRLGVEKEFVLMGSRENVYPYISQCDLFVLTSKYEGKPIAVSEAQILGIPVLVTEYAGAKEQINHNVDGIVVDNTDDLIYNKIVYLLKNIDILNNFKKNLENRNFDELKPQKELERLWGLI